MGDTVIGPRPPNDGREWDGQCARCGSSTVYDLCGACGGDGVIIEDVGELLDEETETPCDVCAGRGGWVSCVSAREWCESHPLPQREHVERGEIEWFVVGGDDG